MNRWRVWRGECVLLMEAEEAVGSYERLRGLLGRRTLLKHEGMLLRHCRAIHTFGMLFPIDVIFLGALGNVVGVRNVLGAQRFALEFAANQVLEVSAGSIDYWELHLDDQLRLEMLGV